MIPALVRWAFLPAHEAILGRSTFQLWQQLQNNPIRDRQHLNQVQTRGLQHLLDHATANIPYWKDRLAGKLSEGSPDHPESRLASVPVLTRAEIQHHREQMRWASPPRQVLLHTSGGTTDDNLIFYWSRIRQTWDRAMRWRGLARHGIYPGDRVLHIWPGYSRSKTLPRLKQMLRVFRDWLINDAVIEVNPSSAESLDAVLAFASRYQPQAIIAYPSWLNALAWRIQKGPPRTWPGLRVLMCTGEVLFSFQRRRIEETFGARVIQEYGSQDAGIIAHEDAEGDLRLNGEQLLVEVLTEGQPSAPGQLGEVVVTHFQTEIMPFIRYATGDVVRQSAREARAGLPIFPWPEGRTSDLLQTMEGELIPMRPVVERLVEQTELEDFSLFQIEPGRLQVFEIKQESEAKRHQAAEAVLREMLGQALTIEWRAGSRFAPLRSGKKRYVCSPLAMRQIAHDKESGATLARAWPQVLEA